MRHKESLCPSLKQILESYFVEIPSTFLATVKPKLLPETVKVIKLMANSLTDDEAQQDFSRSSDLTEWLQLYYTYHEDGGIISGFRGVSLEQNSSSSRAVFFNKASFRNDVEQLGMKKAKSGHIHLVIHELMHLQSYMAKGAITWDYFLVTPHDVRGKLDEGLTEIFARTILYRIIRENAHDFDGVIPEIRVQGGPEFRIPVYECLTEIAVDILQEVGFEIGARAYFEGHWAPFTEKLQACAKYNNIFWKYYQVISHAVWVFRSQKVVVKQLEKCGLVLQSPEELFRSFRTGKWQDSVFSLYPSHIGQSQIHL
eukprot:TRINITY_DN5006_c0_g1_i2.p1 TRINITY_DN5006_c0_g1~~TRINITY_DN5006_c0_g1_i2.p1  ORF type:complete len:313 (+),score=47.80 TRINITY_DN5006_c0_g1_i2:240-1178(+)